MLSIVPLMNGGGLFETGAGGSAPKHVQQFEKENHLRWDSLGEFLALAVSLDTWPTASGTRVPPSSAQLSTTRPPSTCSQQVTVRVRSRARQPARATTTSPPTGPRALANQTEDAALAAKFAPVAKELAANEDKIIAELNEVQGQPMDIGGYYFPNDELARRRMRPSAPLNAIIDAI